GMGVLPLEFKAGTDRKTLGLDGTELYSVIGNIAPRSDLTLVIERSTDDGKEQIIKVLVTCRVYNEEEVSVYEAGGVLQRFAQDFLEGNVA
ncbi:MAG: Fe/S-dependent 2-methylisocitrate dehydratase AcnD, partial [Acinetobacter sp.]